MELPWAVQKAILADASCRVVCVGSTKDEAASLICSDELARCVEHDNKAASAARQTSDEWQFIYDVMRVHKEKVMFQPNHLARIESTYLSVSGQPLPPGALTRLRVQLERYVQNRDVRTCVDDIDGGGHRGGIVDENAVQPHMPDQNVKFLMWLPAASSSSSSGRPAAQSAPPTSTSAAAATREQASSHTDGDKGVVGRGECTSAPAARMYALYFVRSLFPAEEMYTHGAELALMYDARRSNPHAKVVQSTLRSRATALQQRLGVYEVLLVHGAEDHYVIPEGSRSNYILVTEQNELLCSSTDDILIGVTLLSIKEAARHAGLGEVQHRRLHVGDLCACKSFVTLGTSPGTLPVRDIVLYYDEESKHNFERMAEGVGLDVSSVSRIKVTSTDPPRAVLEYETNTEFLRQLRKAYENAAFA